MELLRFATAGSVDDGKSTLIGRLLYDSKQIFEDTLEALEHSTRLRGEVGMNLALLTDGLRAEREQGITIDVAYRYFATPTPQVHHRRHAGPRAVHAQHGDRRVDRRSRARSSSTRATGSSSRSRRHAFLASLLGVPHLVLCVNKMDLVDYDQAVFDRIKGEFRDFAAKLDVHDLTFIPISALHGDNVVDRSANTPWYEGSSLLHHLEEVHIASDRNLIDCRFPVQYVIRPRDDQFHDYRGYAGQVSSGTYKVGDDVVVLPSGFTSKIASIDTADGPVDEAVPPMSVTIRLTDDLDVSRGDMLCRPNNRPTVDQDVDAMLCWFSDRARLQPGGKYALKHTSKWARALVKDLQYRLDVNTLHRDETATSLQLNEIGRVTLRTTQPLFFDDYRRNRATGSFILVDEATNDTLAAGMICRSGSRGCRRRVQRSF